MNGELIDRTIAVLKPFVKAAAEARETQKMSVACGMGVMSDDCSTGGIRFREMFAAEKLHNELLIVKQQMEGERRK